ncbi:MAG: hypothetical protein AAFY42_04625, partial [Pseudomonadota bacterium]
DLKDRVTSGVASIDVEALKEGGAEKVAEMRDRAAEFDGGEVADRAKELGHRAASGVKDLVGRVRNRLKHSESEQTASDHE